MGFVFGIKSMKKSIFCLGGIPERSLGKTSGNSFTRGTDSIGGISESKSGLLQCDRNNPFRLFYMLLDKIRCDL